MTIEDEILQNARQYKGQLRGIRETAGDCNGRRIPLGVGHIPQLAESNNPRDPDRTRCERLELKGNGMNGFRHEARCLRAMARNPAHLESEKVRSWPENARSKVGMQLEEWLYEERMRPRRRKESTVLHPSELKFSVEPGHRTGSGYGRDLHLTRRRRGQEALANL